MANFSPAGVDIRPPLRTGMKVLDRSQFKTELPLVSAEIANPRWLAKLVKECNKDDLLKLPRLPTIVNIDRTRRGILLAPKFADPATAFDELSAETQNLLTEAGFVMKNYALALDYDFWTTEEVLRSILPPELGEVPSGFSQVGHIAHMNLRDEFLPYKHLIGQVVLDKNRSSVKTVVHKLDSIDTVFRTFEMEVLAGVPEFKVEQLESNCRFRFDFREVYWNSRLHTEHDRLVRLFGMNNAICDPMAGVGPFAIPAAKNGNIVLANDLNPHSYEAMKDNVGLNRVNPEVLPTYNEDGRIFIKKSVGRLHALKQRLQDTEIPVMLPKPGLKTNSGSSTSANKRAKNQPKLITVPETFSHYVMNLPASAIEFLDGFRGLYVDQKFSSEDPPLPMVHVHCFFKFSPHEPEPELPAVRKSIAARVSQAMRFEMDPSLLSLHNVRRVAPTKDMYEVSFRLPAEVAYARD